MRGVFPENYFVSQWREVRTTIDYIDSNLWYHWVYQLADNIGDEVRDKVCKHIREDVPCC